MPTNCCVPLCTKKDNRDKVTGQNISFFHFPEDENLKKHWIHVIRRDVGEHFTITEGTRVCSRHFKPENLQRSLNGKRTSLKPGAVPSIFAWKRSSPRKRPPPTPRFTATTVTTKLALESSGVMLSATESSEICGDASSSTNMTGSTFPETAKGECNSDFVEKSNTHLIISELRDRLSAVLVKNEKLEEEVLRLKEKVVDLEQITRSS